MVIKITRIKFFIEQFRSLFHFIIGNYTLILTKPSRHKKNVFFFTSRIGGDRISWCAVCYPSDKKKTFTKICVCIVRMKGELLQKHNIFLRIENPYSLFF